MTHAKTEHLLINEEIQVQEDNALEKIYSHFIKEQNGDPIPFGTWEMSCTALEVVGGTGGIYIWPIVKEFVKGKTPWIAWSFLITNPLSNVLFLINAADDLSDNMITELNPPPQLKDILKPLSGKELVAKYVKMGTGAVVCSIPFGAATYLFPLPTCESAACLGITITHSMVSNTVLHAIAWDIILKPDFWIYRLPFIPFEKGYEYVRNNFRTLEEKKQLAINSKRDAIYQTYKTILSQAFTQAADRIVSDYLKTRSPETLRELGNSSVTTYVAGNSIPITSSFPLPSWKSYLYSTHNFFRGRIVKALGASATIIGGVAWIGNPIYLGLQEGLTLTESIAAGGIPTYSTLVLFAFYGSHVSAQLYDYLTTWSGIRSKLSLEAQLYPKTFILFLPINLYIAFFAYAGAQQLITTIFSDDMWEDYRPFFQETSQPVFQILSFIPLLNLFNTFIRKSMAKFGAENDDQLAARLLAKNHAMLLHLQNLDGPFLMESIADYNDHQKKMFRIDPEKFQEDLKTLEQLEQLEKNDQDSLPALEEPILSTGTSRFSFWCCRKTDESVSLLATNTSNDQFCGAKV